MNITLQHYVYFKHKNISSWIKTVSIKLILKNKKKSAPKRRTLVIHLAPKRRRQNGGAKTAAPNWWRQNVPFRQNWFGFATQRFCIPFQSPSHWFENFEFIYEKYNSLATMDGSGDIKIFIWVFVSIIY